MKHHITSLLCLWVDFVESRARWVLAALALITLFAAGYAYQNFTINSDLGDLINPSEENRWYANSEAYKKAFPQYRHTALVVVSGASASATYDSAEILVKALNQSGKFKEVFAPAFDAFFQDRVLYSVPSEGVKRISQKVLDKLPELERLIKNPEVSQLLAQLEVQLIIDQDREFLSEHSRHQMAVIVEAVKQLSAGEKPVLAMVENLKPRDTDEMHYQIIVLKSAMHFTQEQPNAVIVANIRQVIQQLAIPNAIDVRISGEVALANDEIAAGMSGVEFAGMLSLVLLALILGLGIRSLRVITSIFIMLLMGIIWTAAYATATIGSYNTLSLIFLVMFFGLGVDFAVHYCLRLIEERQKQISNLDQADDVRSCAVIATADIGTTLLLCAITSSIAFLAFLPTEYNGLAELGIISAGGMAIAFMLSLTFFPAWFSVMGYGQSVRQVKAKPIVMHEQTGFMSPALILAVTAMLAALAFWYAKDVRFNYSVLAMRDKDSEAMSTLLEMQQQGIVTDYSIFVMADENTDITQLKADLQALSSVASVELPQDNLPQFQQIKQQYMLPVHRRLSQLRMVQAPQEFDVDVNQQALSHMLSLLDIEHQDVFFDEDEVEVKAFVKALMLLKERLPYQLDFNRAIAEGINADVQLLQRWFSAQPYELMDLPENVRARLYSEQYGLLLNVIPLEDMTLRENTDQFVAQVIAVAPNVAGRTVIEWGIGKVVVESFVQAIAIAITGIIVLLALYFRAVLPVVLVLIPLLLSTLFTFAFIQISGLTLNMANILVVPLIFGLGVDTGIHVIHRYHQSYSLQEMLFSSTSKAVLISALTTIGTFISLSFSAHKGAASIGLLLSVAITLLLLTTFIVLPALLNVFDRKSLAPE
ncbi:MAG: MMPL family transporter [Pseudomonadales bacterium]|nr:MMPL family transporter [Pseudomonadales bacterium]